MFAAVDSPTAPLTFMVRRSAQENPFTIGGSTRQ